MTTGRINQVSRLEKQTARRPAEGRSTDARVANRESFCFKLSSERREGRQTADKLPPPSIICVRGRARFSHGKRRPTRHNRQRRAGFSGPYSAIRTRPPGSLSAEISPRVLISYHAKGKGKSNGEWRGKSRFLPLRSPDLCLSYSFTPFIFLPSNPPACSWRSAYAMLAPGSSKRGELWLRLVLLGHGTM